MSEKPLETWRSTSGRFQPGNPGGGRTVGARTKLSERFLTALHDDFALHGPGVIERLRVEAPVAYCKLCAYLVPRQVRIEHSSDLAHLTDQQLETVERLLRSEQAKTIEALMINGDVGR